MTPDISPELQREVLRTLGAGTFRLDAQARWVETDAALRELLGRLPETWVQSCFDQAAARQLLQRARAAQGRPISERLLVCRDGKRPFWAQVVLHALHDPQGHFQGWQGVMWDATAEEVRRRVEQLPVGFYIVRRDPQGDERIVYASPGFTRLYRFEAPEQALGSKIARLFLNPQGYAEFIAFLKRQSAQKAGVQSHEDAQGPYYTLLGWKNMVRDRQENQHHVTVDLGWRQDPDTGVIVERWGILRDVRRDRFFSTQVHDYSVVLHTYSSALLGARHALDALKRMMQPDPFERKQGRIPPKQLEDTAERLLNRYEQRFVRGLQAVLAQAEERGLQAMVLERFREYLERLDAMHRSRTTLAWRIPVYVELGSRVLHHVQRLREQRPPAPAVWFAREVLRQARVAAWDLARIAALVVIYQQETHLLEVDNEVRLFRDFWSEPFRGTTTQKVDLVHVLESSMLALDEFARQRGVTWRRYGAWPAEAWVQGNERALQRAFSHLLHNAVKYSWQRARGTWVGVRVRAHGEFWQVEIENYGVAIAPDEIESGSIFQFGYRGRLSQDRSRVGTGIGLYDARRVFELHGGEVTLESRPASAVEDDHALEDRQRQEIPHLTVARVRLPRRDA